MSVKLFSNYSWSVFGYYPDRREISLEHTGIEDSKTGIEAYINFQRTADFIPPLPLDMYEIVEEDNKEANNEQETKVQSLPTQEDC